MNVDARIDRDHANGTAIFHERDDGGTGEALGQDDLASDAGFHLGPRLKLTFEGVLFIHVRGAVDINQGTGETVRRIGAEGGRLGSAGDPASFDPCFAGKAQEKFGLMQRHVDPMLCEPADDLVHAPVHVVGMLALERGEALHEGPGFIDRDLIQQSGFDGGHDILHCFID